VAYYLYIDNKKMKNYLCNQKHNFHNYVINIHSFDSKLTCDLHAQLYLLLDNIRTTLKASFVILNTNEVIHTTQHGVSLMGNQGFWCVCFFYRFSSINTTYDWIIRCIVLQIMYLILWKFHRWFSTPQDRPPTYQGLVRPNLWGRWTGDHPGEDKRT
jgi:hypothetical protein